MPAALSSGVMSAVAPPMSVRTQPGWKATQVTPFPPKVRAVSISTEFSAALLARYSEPTALWRSLSEPMREDSTASLPRAAHTIGAMTGSSRIAASTLVCITLSKSDWTGKPSWRGPYTPAFRMATSSCSSSSFQPMPATASTSLTSSRCGSAPSAPSVSQSASWRAVAITRHPAARYWRTSSRPMPREAPMMSAVGISGQLDADGRRFAAADAQRRHAALAAAVLQRAQQRDDDARAGGADRVAQRAGAAVHIDLAVRDVQLVHGRHRHGRKRLVDFEQVDVVHLPAVLCQQLLDRAHGSRREFVRRQRIGGVANHAGDDGGAQLLRRRFAHHHQGGGAVVDRRGRSGRDGAVLLEGRFQRRNLVQLGLDGAFVLVDDGVAAAAGNGHGRDFPGELATRG